MTRTTLLDIAKANGSDAIVGLIEEVIPAVPELAYFPARTIRGLNYKTLVRTALPTVKFRGANEGTPASKSTFENRNVDTFIMNPRWECDQAVADAHEDGSAAYIAMEATGITTAAGITVASQLYYGTGNDKKGFPGMVSAVDASMLVDAGGGTADTGSSVFAVRFGDQAAKLVVGLNGQFSLSDLRVETLFDADGNPFDGYVQTMLTRIGLQIGSRYTVGRIRKITEEANHTLNDAMLGRLMMKFPVGFKPDAFFLSRRSMTQLQESRTATNATGAEAPFPTDYQKIPLVLTDSIVDTEPLTL